MILLRHNLTLTSRSRRSPAIPSAADDNQLHKLEGKVQYQCVATICEATLYCEYCLGLVAYSPGLLGGCNAASGTHPA